MDVDGVDFQECFTRKKVTVLSGTEVNFLSVQDLIIAKKKAGRLRDLADAEELEILVKKKEEE